MPELAVIAAASAASADDDHHPMTRDAALVPPPMACRPTTTPTHDDTGAGEMRQADLSHHQAQHDMFQTGQRDACGGNAGRGDDYCDHAKPICMTDQVANAGDDAIIGWALDGFPIYGDNIPDGSVIAEGDPDICNGQIVDTSGVRDPPSDQAPIVRCLIGVATDWRRLPRVRRLTAADGSGAPPGRPPRGGVETLVFTEHVDGSRRMNCRYQGEDQCIRHMPSDMLGC